MNSRLVVLGVLLLVPVVLLACSGARGDSPPVPALATFEADFAEAQLTPVSDELLDYARAICEPTVAHIEGVLEALDEEGVAELREAMFTPLAGPALIPIVTAVLFRDANRRYANALEEIEPQPEAREVHEFEIAQARILAESGDFLLDIREGRLVDHANDPRDALELLQAPDPEVEAEVEAAILLECGIQLRDAHAAFDWSVLDPLETPPATWTPAPTATRTSTPEPTQVDPAERSYAQALCGPFRAWGEAYTFPEQEAPHLAAELRAIEPPPAFQAFHDQMIWLVEHRKELQRDGLNQTPKKLAPVGFLNETIVVECDSLVGIYMLTGAPYLTVYLD